MKSFEISNSVESTQVLSLVLSTIYQSFVQILANFVKKYFKVFEGSRQNPVNLSTVTKIYLLEV
jgi:hypothetical protein